MVDTSTVIEGGVKFRDGKKWKSRWCVMRKLSPVADCLHLQLYRDSKERYKQAHTKASLSLQHFLAVEAGFTLDKESNTLAILCQDVTVVLAFDSRERLIQWQVKISSNLGDDQQFLIQISSAPPKAKLSNGPARLHVHDQRFCITAGVPPRLLAFWEIAQLRRYGVVEGRFCFEGGSRCGRGEGLHVCVTDQGHEIAATFQLAAQGRLCARRRPPCRNLSAMESPRKQSQSRMSDLSCEDGGGALSRSLCCSEDLLCVCRLHQHGGVGGGTGSPFWSSAESAAELDSNCGCGDAASVNELADMECAWSVTASGDGTAASAASLERCASCISKLGAASMSRSSTATNSNTPTAPFSPAWTMDGIGGGVGGGGVGGVCLRASDRMSVSSHGSSANSDYCVPRMSASVNLADGCWYDRPRTVGDAVTHPSPPPLVPPKSPKATCPCCPPSRPPKPRQASASGTTKKPPMPLPVVPVVPMVPANQTHVCVCVQPTRPDDNYDIPKSLLGAYKEGRPASAASEPSEHQQHYDTPRNIREWLPDANYDTPASMKALRRSMVVTSSTAMSTVTMTTSTTEGRRAEECPCQRVTRWVLLPYCRRGGGVEPTGVAIHKVRLSGEGKMPVVTADGQLTIYDTTSKSLTGSPGAGTEAATACGGGALQVDCAGCERCSTSNYVNVDAAPGLVTAPAAPVAAVASADYENIDFAQSLEYYENSKDVIQRAGISRHEVEGLIDELGVAAAKSRDEPSSMTNAVNTSAKVCNKCGHSYTPEEEEEEQQQVGAAGAEASSTTTTAGVDATVLDSGADCGGGEQDDYLMMEPAKGAASGDGRSHPGYLPMSPITNCGGGSTKAEVLALRVDSTVSGGGSLLPGKSASIPSLAGERTKYPRVPGSAMMVLHQSANSPYLRRLVVDAGDDMRRGQLMTRKRSSSADSSRYLDDCGPFDQLSVDEVTAPTTTATTPTPTSTLPCGAVSPQKASASPEAAVHIRRSSSVPCKSATNRDSSSSNDSGVWTASVKQAADFELPLTTAMSTLRHQHAAPRPPAGLSACLHASLPRRSKSVDPVRDLRAKTRPPAKSSSAEAEVPVCVAKRDAGASAKGYHSPGADGAMVVPYMDSRSTSSGTSDMSDYIETLSVSSHSSSDTPDSLRLGRPATTMLRPRSGKEYQLIDRTILDGDLKAHCMVPAVPALRTTSTSGTGTSYANITPVPEKSESPSPGYMSGSPGPEPLVPAPCTK